MGTGQIEEIDHDAARMNAAELARSEIGRNIDSVITSLTDKMMDNEQDAAAIATIICELKVAPSQDLGRVMTVLEAYRELSNKKKEVQMRLALKVSISDVLEMAKKTLRDELMKRGVKLSEKAMKLLEKDVKL